MKPGDISIPLQARSTDLRLPDVRKGKNVPAVIYGAGLKNGMTCMTPASSILKYGSHQYENTIFKVDSTDGALTGKMVLLKEITRHPVTRNPLHVDFYSVDMNKPVRVPVEFRFEGKAAGLADGGTVQPVLRELLIECLPTKIPDSIVVDVSSLKIADSLHIKDIQFPDGVKPVTHENLTIVTCIYIKEEVITQAVAADATAAAAEPEVIAKGKPKEGDAAGAAAPAAGAKADKK